MSANKNERIAFDKNDRYAMDQADINESELTQDELNNVAGGARLWYDKSDATVQRNDDKNDAAMARNDDKNDRLAL